MQKSNELFDRVQEHMDRLVSDNVSWSVPVTHEEIVRYLKEGRKAVNFFLPQDAWLADIRGKQILCLAGAGGQQGPLLAAAGAAVTVFDLSGEMLRRDRETAERESLTIRVQQGNMCNLSAFPDESFDCILNPPSLMYVPDVLPVFRECRRVLKTDGTLILCAPNPLNYIWEYDAAGKPVICNTLPYRSPEHDNQGDWIEYGHTLESYLGGLTENGLTLTGFYEEPSEEPFESYFVVRAEKHS